MLMIEYRDVGWWYWLVTAALLTLGISGDQIGFELAIGLNLVQLIHYILWKRSLSEFPVQVRFWYLLLLLASLPAPMQWLYWVPFIGTWAQVTVGYCAMARLVSLFPWNRTGPLNLKLIQTTFLSRPVHGSVKQGFAED